MKKEYQLLTPELIIPVGKLAMKEYLSFSKLTEVVGQIHQIEVNGVMTDVIPLPHPSGLSTWFQKEPGKGLLSDALSLIKQHRSWLKHFS